MIKLAILIILSLIIYIIYLLYRLNKAYKMCDGFWDAMVEKDKINKDLKNKEKDLIVSEHAVIRYIERVLGINIKDLECKILPKETVEIIKKLGNGKYSVNENEFEVVAKDNVIVTVL